MVCWRSISSSWRTSFLFLLQSNGGGLSHQRVCAQSPLVLVPRTDPNLIQANEKVHRRPLRREMYQVRSVWRFQPMIKEGLGIYLHCHPSFVIQKRPQPSKGSSCHPTRGISFPSRKVQWVRGNVPTIWGGVIPSSNGYHSERSWWEIQIRRRARKKRWQFSIDDSPFLRRQGSWKVNILSQSRIWSPPRRRSFRRTIDDR